MELDILKQLVPNVWTLLAQWGATLILFLVFRKYLYKPIVAFLDQRAELTQNDLQQAAQEKASATLLKEQASTYYQQVVQESSDIIAQSHRTAMMNRDAILQQAKLEVENIKLKAQQEIAMERAQMLADIESEIVDVAMKASQQLLHKEVDETYQKETLQSVMTELRN